MNITINPRPLIALTLALLVPACGLFRKKIPKGLPDGTAEGAEVVTAPDTPYVAADVSTASGLLGTLKAGDTIDVQVFEGVRTTRSILSEHFTLNGSGQVALPKIGMVSVSGLTIPTAIQSIESSYRRADWSAGLRSTAHISSWNGRPVVLIDGSVRRPGAYTPPAFLAAAVGQAGGAKTESSYIYSIRDGVRSTISLEDAATYPVEAGDIIRIPLGF